MSVVLVDDDDDLRGIVRNIIAAAADIEIVGDVGLAISEEPDVIVLYP